MRFALRSEHEVFYSGMPITLTKTVLILRKKTAIASAICCCFVTIKHLRDEKPRHLTKTQAIA
ncbi:hypothetical protein BZG74_05470 [Salinivibrio sharmensis]|uniref:Uncharacterized protein n=2 Tax=Salinivibrio sharmensis TaxID=390883 RepID=A0ABX3KJ98_9GAMM|nr:hypothetical protein BZG74_05470 [Salinivibrio sharmensis]